MRKGSPALWAAGEQHPGDRAATQPSGVGDCKGELGLVTKRGW